MSKPISVLVYEYFTGGGSPPGELSPGLAAEALGMVWALLEEFRRWGACRTISALDPRFEEQIPGLNRKTFPSDELSCVSHDNHQEAYVSLLKRCEAAIIIAPETDGILADLTAEAEWRGKQVLGSSSAAVKTAGDKSACSTLFGSAKLPIPKTYSVSFREAPEAAHNLGFPLVIKPVDGVGSTGVFRVDCLSDFSSCLAILRQNTAHDRVLLQGFEKGTHVSVSLLGAENRAVPLSLNRQLMKDGPLLQYMGSEVPFDHRNAGSCMQLACDAASLIPGLRGYVGVDLVVNEEYARIIEINPRLTTSFIGLRQVYPDNLARAIWNACVPGVIADPVPCTGRVVVKKNDPSSWGLSLE